MKANLRKATALILLVMMGLTSAQRSEAAVSVGIVEIIKAAVVKVIKAVDLKIQRMQNKTIWLQNAQKVLENSLSKLKLDEISEWTEKQKEQYRVYFEELKKVKSIISSYQRIREISEKQFRLVNEYNRAWNLLRQDDHFNNDEIEYMGKVYGGILEESLKNIDQISLVVQSFSTQMSDAKRLELINKAADQVDANFDDLLLFNRQNMIMSLQRAKTKHEAEAIKKFYGLK